MMTAPTPEGVAAPGRPTVLCIDDDPLVLHFYRNFVTTCGYRTLTVLDGAQEIALTHQNRPEVILRDVMLRGLSGYDICRKLRTHSTLQDTPIIRINAWDDPSVTTTGLVAGSDDHPPQAV